ncbi:MAG: DegT/DnrJ/EryC1/StrS family aminotransferase [Anaerolineales bacterium]
MAEIPFLDVGAAYAELKTELDAAYQRVMASGWYILGPEVEAFEAEFAAACGARFAVGVGNGLEALHLMLRAAGIGPGDEVIVPANTYIATWLAVSYAGARPVPVEPDALTCNLDPNRVEAAISPRTRAVLTVHLYGQPAEMDALSELCARRGLLLFDDAAQAQGARYRHRPVGSLALATGWSFYPGKNLGAYGDAGAVTTSDPALAEKIRRLRNYGSEAKYHNEIKGYNSRLDPLQAAFLRVKLPQLPAWNARRAQIAQYYRAELAQLPGLILPYAPAHLEPCWHLFVIRHPQRDALQAHLRAEGVQTLIHYPIPPHLQPAYAEMGLSSGAFPISEQIHAQALSLPIGPHLTPEQAQRVVAAVRSFFDRP